MDPALTADAIGVGGTVIVGVAGFVANVRNTSKTTALALQGQLTDRYSKAVEQLGSEKLDVRIGGIYALERIARDSPRDHPTIMEVLAAFIREHSHEQWPLAEPGTEPPARTRRPDVQAAITVLARRTVQYDSQPINLQDAILTQTTLARADLVRADLFRVTLTEAYLGGADLTEAVLYAADLTGASLRDANLTRATLIQANLTRAILRDANLTRARLRDANLTDAKLTGADLTGADFTGADLTGADLTGAVWGLDQEVPEGWQRDTNSGRLKRVSANTGGVGN